MQKEGPEDKDYIIMSSAHLRKLEALADSVRKWKQAHETVNDMLPHGGDIKWQEAWVTLAGTVEVVAAALEALDGKDERRSHHD